MELVSAFKKNATSSLLLVPVVKSKAPEEAHVVDVEEVFSCDYKEKTHVSASASAAGLIHPFSRYSQGMQVALVFLGSSLVFELYLHEEYEGFYWD